MPRRNVRVRAEPSNVPALHPETFGGEPVPVVFPPGTTGFTKVTNPEAEGPGRYLGFSTPPTVESAARRLVLPSTNRAEEVRTYRNVEPLYANVGTVAGSRTNDLQVEAFNSDALEEVSRRRLLYDFESRLVHAGEAAVVGGIVGAIVGIRLGNPLLGLIVGLAIGFFLGLIAPTDWGDLLSGFFGTPDVNVMLML